jgi:glycerol-3-phosphate cytidylyltransferase
MKTIITYGTFDVLHFGHVELLRRAKEMGDYLIVGLSTDQFNANKHKQSFYAYNERKKILEAIKYVDKVIPEDNWEQKVGDIKKYDVDIFVMGDDWRGEFDELKEYAEVVYLPRTPDISSTGVKHHLKSRDF